MRHIRTFQTKCARPVALFFKKCKQYSQNAPFSSEARGKYANGPCQHSKRTVPDLAPSFPKHAGKMRKRATPRAKRVEHTRRVRAKRMRSLVTFQAKRARPVAFFTNKCKQYAQNAHLLSGETRGKYANGPSATLAIVVCILLHRVNCFRCSVSCLFVVCKVTPPVLRWFFHEYRHLRAVIFSPASSALYCIAKVCFGAPLPICSWYARTPSCSALARALRVQLAY